MHALDILRKYTAAPETTVAKPVSLQVGVDRLPWPASARTRRRHPRKTPGGILQQMQQAGCCCPSCCAWLVGIRPSAPFPPPPPPRVSVVP